MKPLPTKLVLHFVHMKHSVCQWSSSSEMNLHPPNPVVNIVEIKYCEMKWNVIKFSYCYVVA